MTEDIFASTDELIDMLRIAKKMVNIYSVDKNFKTDEQKSTYSHLEGRLAILKAWLNYLYEERDLKKVAPNSTIVWNEALESRIAEQIRRIEEALR